MGKDTGVKSKGDGTPMKAATKQPVTPSPIKPNLDSPFVSASKTRALYTDLDCNCILDVVRYGSRTQRLRKNDDIVEISLLKVNVFNPKDGILRSFIHEVWPPGSELADHFKRYTEKGRMNSQYVIFELQKSEPRFILGFKDADLYCEFNGERCDVSIFLSALLCIY